MSTRTCGTESVVNSGWLSGAWLYHPHELLRRNAKDCEQRMAVVWLSRYGAKRSTMRDLSLLRLRSPCRDRAVT